MFEAASEAVMLLLLLLLQAGFARALLPPPPPAERVCCCCDDELKSALVFGADGFCDAADDAISEVDHDSVLNTLNR